MDLKQLRHKKGQAYEEIKSLIAQREARTEGENVFTKEESEKFDKAHNDMEGFDKQIREEEKVQEFRAKEASEKIEQEKRAHGNKDAKTEKEVKNKAFGKYLRYGYHGLDIEERTVLSGMFTSVGNEQRAQTTGTGSSGGYTIPEDFSGQIESALLDFGGVREAATVFRTATGSALPWPTSNGTATKGRRIGENTTVTTTDLAFGQKTFEAYLYSSDAILVPFTLMQDEGVNLEGFIRDQIAERIGRITNEEFTTGTGSSQPNGIVTASVAGPTAAATTTFTWQELVDLEHSVGSAYRKNGKFMMTDAALKAAKKLVDSNGDPIFLSGLANNAPSTILGYQYIINDDMAVPAASAKSILFGDLKKYMIRDVMGITIMRLDELYAADGQVGFFAWSRHDGELLDAGTNPVKHLVQAAS